MVEQQRNEKILFIAAGLILLSIFLMAILLIGIFLKISPVIPAKSAVIATSVIILIHMTVFGGYLKSIHDNRRNSENRKGIYIGLSILVAFLGLLYMNGAFAALNDGNNIFGAITMFVSSFCDFVASVITIILFFLRAD